MASALHLARSGKKVKIIERLPWVGGLSKTFERGPYKLDLGPHRFTPHNERVYRLVKDLIPDDLRVVQYKAEIWLDNKFVSYPFQLKNLLLKLSPWLSLQMTLREGSCRLSSESSAERGQGLFQSRPS
jgi:protoporphyrinogen oxidase